MRRVPYGRASRDFKAGENELLAGHAHVCVSERVQSHRFPHARLQVFGKLRRFQIGFAVFFLRKFAQTLLVLLVVCQVVHGEDGGGCSCVDATCQQLQADRDRVSAAQ